MRPDNKPPNLKTVGAKKYADWHARKNKQYEKERREYRTIHPEITAEELSRLETLHRPKKDLST